VNLNEHFLYTVFFLPAPAVRDGWSGIFSNHRKISIIPLWLIEKFLSLQSQINEAIYEV